MNPMGLALPLATGAKGNCADVGFPSVSREKSHKIFVKPIISTSWKKDSRLTLNLPCRGLTLSPNLLGLPLMETLLHWENNLNSPGSFSQIFHIAYLCIDLQFMAKCNNPCRFPSPIRASLERLPLESLSLWATTAYSLYLCVWEISTPHVSGPNRCFRKVAVCLSTKT